MVACGTLGAAEEGASRAVLLSVCPVSQELAIRAPPTLWPVLRGRRTVIAHISNPEDGADGVRRGKP